MRIFSSTDLALRLQGSNSFKSGPDLKAFKHLAGIKMSLFLVLFLSGSVLFAQDPIGSETVTVVKPYSPSVRDASKIKQMPGRADSVNLAKKEVKYSIFSVPVASTFTPAKGRATTVERERPPKVFNNYATLGFGNYSNVLAEFYSNLEVNRTDNFGVFLTHNSSQGGIEGVRLDDKFYDTELNLSYTRRDRDLSWKTEVGGQHQLFNWYGLPESPALTDAQVLEIDPQQNYFSVYAGGEIELYDSFFDRAKAKFRHSGDSYSSSENQFDATAAFEANIAGELITTNITADIVNGSFDKAFYGSNGYDYTFMNFGLNPSLLVLRDDLTLNLGIAFYYSLDTQNSDSNFYLYPKITASYELAGDMLTAYGGIEGELEQNTYYDFYQDNHFVSPTLAIQPTDTEYDAYVGAKGRLTNSLGYNARVSYSSQFNKAMYRRNPYAIGVTEEDYAYGNSFEVVYDDINTFSFYGEVNVDVNRNFTLSANAEVFSYSTEEEVEAWNLPQLTAALTADYQITEKWYTGANIFYRGERKDLSRTVITNPVNPEQNEVVTLDGYFDLNAHLGYRFNEQLSAFIKGSNLLNNNYERWMNFPVQGAQFLAGATYKFDF
ncbi:TonB-dependent receptor [Zunongwangia sp. F363]|uniref:TonB-dependent receptor n=1 Tax=Autumnicola tepida TaxID=3075595 RepID=A0ABU3CEI5_9FLAO|nr:TonB-dependent receptor [Zunongwangia sp. F363]MDT0644716.1 TonB-dependent receptor [Zunongwangia sp. F363]